MKKLLAFLLLPLTLAGQLADDLAWPLTQPIATSTTDGFPWGEHMMVPVLEQGTSTYYVAGSRTDSQSLTNLGNSGAEDAQYGTTSGADSDDPITLDWSSYVTSDFIVNGTFATDTAWSKETGWTISSGVATCTNGSGAFRLHQTQAPEIYTGGVYEVSFDLVTITGGFLNLRIAGTANIAHTVVGSYQHIFTAISALGNEIVTLESDAATGFAGTVDNVTIREISLPVHPGDHSYLPGSTGNYASSPDSVATSVTGDITLTIKVALDDWSSALIALLGKWSASPQFSYVLRLSATGFLTFLWSEDGTASKSEACNVVVPFLDGEVGSVRVTMDVDNGASDAEIKFWISTDGVTFTQLGATDTNGSTTSIFDGTTPIGLGARSGGTAHKATGDFYYASIHSNATGTGDPDWQFDASLSVQAGYTDAFCGDTIALNRSAAGPKLALVTRPIFSLDIAASRFMTTLDHADLDGESGDFTVWLLGRAHSGPGNSKVYVAKKTVFGGTDAGYSLSSRTDPGLRMYIGDGSSAIFNTNLTGTYDSTTFLESGVRRTADGEIEAFRDATGSGSPSADALGSVSNSVAFTAGTDGGGSQHVDLEVFAYGYSKGVAMIGAQLGTIDAEILAITGGRTGE